MVHRGKYNYEGTASVKMRKLVKRVVQGQNFFVPYKVIQGRQVMVPYRVSESQQVKLQGQHVKTQGRLRSRNSVSQGQYFKIQGGFKTESWSLVLGTYKSNFLNILCMEEKKERLFTK